MKGSVGSDKRPGSVRCFRLPQSSSTSIWSCCSSLQPCFQLKGRCREELASILVPLRLILPSFSPPPAERAASSGRRAASARKRNVCERLRRYQSSGDWLRYGERPRNHRWSARSCGWRKGRWPNRRTAAPTEVPDDGPLSHGWGKRF